MALVETILNLASPALGAGEAVASSVNLLSDFLKGRAKLEEVLAELVEDRFTQHLPRLTPMCIGGPPSFDKAQFVRILANDALTVEAPGDLIHALTPALRVCVILPGAIRSDGEIDGICHSILNASLRGMWKRIGSYPALTNEFLLEQAAATASELPVLRLQVLELTQQVERLAAFAKDAWSAVYDRLLDTAPPPEHTIGASSYLNPFLLARAEDFNHNYENIARLFQDSPEWDSIQSRTDNVFIEGGRGTGKSMLLRRLTAQTTLAATRLLGDRHASFGDSGTPYFGVYVKLTRGYYEQFGSSDVMPSSIADVLSQHELNIEIFDAFVDAVIWLVRQRALPEPERFVPASVVALAKLFPHSPPAYSLEDLQDVVVQFEHQQIADYYRDRALGRPGHYAGSSTDCVAFLRRLSETFRKHLFPKDEIRLFLLIDEFETLLPVQQKAINTVMKMRLPDLTCKIAVRRSGRKTSETFTPADPIQDPRDYTRVILDYDATDPAYAAMLLGIAEKRLRHAEYLNTNLRDYLPAAASDQLPTALKIDAALIEMWQSGNRRTEAMNSEFVEKYRHAAIYRALNAAHRRKSHAGVDQYVLLSSGVASNFIELCKYAFYFALADKLPLRENPPIPDYLQTEAAYGVSWRLLGTIESNVPRVGMTLHRLITDLGEILRSRLLRHPSEPEVIRLSVRDFQALSTETYKDLAEVLDAAIVWSVLHHEAGPNTFKPRNRDRPPSAELVINRIYSPALGLSPRSRWRVEVSLSDLKGLINDVDRPATYKALMKTVGYSDDPQTDSQQSLFETI